MRDSAQVQTRSPLSEMLWHKPLVSGTDNVGERRGNFCLKLWDRRHELLCLVLQKSQPSPHGHADPPWVGAVQERPVQGVPRPAGAVVVLWGFARCCAALLEKGAGQLVCKTVGGLLKKRKSQRWDPAGLSYISWVYGYFDLYSAPLIQTWLLQPLHGDFSS